VSHQFDILDGLPPDGPPDPPPRDPEAAPGTHPDPGTLQTHLDRALPTSAADDVEAHLQGCPQCRGELAFLEALGRQVRTELEAVGQELLPRSPGDLDRCRWEMRRDQASAGGRGPRRRNAATATGLLVVAAAIAAVIPGSPLRSLFTDAAPSTGTDVTAPPSEPETGGGIAGMTGVAVGFREGRVEVVLEDARPGTGVELVVGTGDRVEVLAPEGTRFRAAAGSVSVELAGGEGGVLIRIPPGPGDVLLRSGLRHLARWSGGAFQFGEGIAADPRSDGVLLLVP